MSQKMISCKACGKEIAANAKACPECGAKNKKPIYKKWWAWAIVIVILIAVVSGGGDKSEKIVWDNMVLGQILPKPPAKKGSIHENSDEGLWIVVNNISDKQFSDYITACKEQGFSLDAETSTFSYEAYDVAGYKLALAHYGADADMSIDLDAPMSMAEISWPTSAAGEKLPAPKSTVGKFSFEYDDNFFVYVGNTSMTDYSEYVEACAAKGFDVDYSKGEDYYYADNAEGWHVSVRYEGNNTMSIDIDAPKENNNDSANPPIADDTERDDAVSSLDSGFKAAMDSYEAFMDEYVAFMEKYKNNPADMSLLTDYTDYMSRYADFVEDFEKWEDEEMNAAEAAYYVEVQARVSKKLVAVAY